MLTSWLNIIQLTFIELDERLGCILIELVVQTSAETEPCFVVVVRFELRILNVLFGFAELPISPEKVNQPGQDCIFIGFLLQNSFKLLNGLVILVGF